MQLQIKIVGKERVEEKMRKLFNVLKDVTPELTEAGKEMKRFFEIDVFETHGGALGENWAPLSYKYLTKKQVEFPGREILERTGNMRKGFRLFVGPRQAKIKNIMPYAKYHQQPDGEGSGFMPRRRFMGMSYTQAKRLRTIFERSLNKRLGGV